MSKTDHFIARHIIEIRHKNRFLSFMDYKGELGDFVIKKMKWENIHATSTRMELASQEGKEMFFYSWENCGLQIEASESFSDFHKTTEEFFGTIREYKRYPIEKVVRLGVKSFVLFHKHGMSLEGLKEKFYSFALSHKTGLEEKLKMKVSDIALIGLDLEAGEAKIRMTIGPVSKEEALAKFFSQNKSAYEKFGYSSGIYFEIDMFEEEIGETSLDAIAEKVKKHITGMEKTIADFNDYFFNEQKDGAK